MDAAPVERRESPARVLWTFAVLALFLGAVASIAQGFFTRPVDGAAKQREYFGERPPPFGLALESATRLPTGDALVRFTRAGEGPGPDELFLIEYASPAGAEGAFRVEPMGGEGMGPMGGGEGGGAGGGAGAMLAEWEKEKAFEWHTTLKRDVIAWGDLSSKLWIERQFRKGGGWRDQARVDLSSPARALVLFAHWPVDRAADERELRELLASLVLAAPL